MGGVLYLKCLAYFMSNFPIEALQVMSVRAQQGAEHYDFASVGAILTRVLAVMLKLAYVCFSADSSVASRPRIRALTFSASPPSPFGTFCKILVTLKSSLALSCCCLSTIGEKRMRSVRMSNGAFSQGAWSYPAWCMTPNSSFCGFWSAFLEV